MFTMSKDDVILQGIDMHGMHKSFTGSYSDLSRLLEPNGRVFTMAGGIKLFWKGDSEFTTNSKDDGLWIGTRLQAMEKLIELFGNKDGIISVNAIKGFFFEAVNTQIRFQYVQEERYKGFKIWDEFNGMWRGFEIYLGANGVEIDTKNPVAINFRDVVTDIRINANIENRRVTNAWVNKEGNLGVVEFFMLYNNNGLFDQLMLEKLPEDHANFEVVTPTNLYPNNSGIYGAFNHQHMGGMGGFGSMQPGTGKPLY